MANRTLSYAHGMAVVQICGMRTCVSGPPHYPQASSIAFQIVGAAPP